MILALLMIATATTAERSNWSTGSALTMPDGRIEFGLSSAWRYGLEPDLEISTQPFADLLYPHLAAKKHWGSSGSWHFASVHDFGLSSIFQHQIAREGSGGLLPADSEIPFSFILGTEGLATLDLGSTLVTLGAGLTFGPRFGEGLPILDFPFLYPRFAALNSPLSTELEARIEGELGALGYRAELSLYAWPGADRGWAIEPNFALGWIPSDHFRLELGCRLSVADYPIGVRFHALPTFDIAIAI